MSGLAPHRDWLTPEVQLTCDNGQWLMGQLVTRGGIQLMDQALSQLHEIKIETIDRFIIAGLIKLYNDLLVNHGPVKRKMLLNLL